MNIASLADAVVAERQRPPADRETGASDADLDLVAGLLAEGRVAEVRRFVTDHWSLTADLTERLCAIQR